MFTGSPTAPRGSPPRASKFATAKGLKLKVTVEVAPEGGISKQKLEETKASLRELGMNDDLSPA